MPYAKSITSYPDVQKLFDQALASSRGMKLTFETEAEAIYQSGRFNAFRVRDRKENAKVYPADHQMHGNSAYDGLMVSRRGAVVLVKKLDFNAFNAEEIGADE